MKVAKAVATSAAQQPRIGLSRASLVYFRLLVALTLSIGLASFVRDRGQLLSNISLWLFLASFAVSLWRTHAGLLATTLLLTVSPSLHDQLNVLAGTSLHAWAYPGVDCCLGFLTATALKGELQDVDVVLERFPSGTLLFLHAWLALSAVITTGRNIWQSASELSVRGLAYNVWLTRGLTFQDDYFPLQDLFFYSVASLMLFSVWAVVSRCGDRIVRGLAATVLLGAVANALFANWQKLTGKGWIVGTIEREVTAFWPDIHSLGPLLAMAIVSGLGLVWSRKLNSGQIAAVSAAVFVAALGLYVSGSRSTLLILCLLLIVAAILAAVVVRGWRRVIPIVCLLALAATLDWLLARGYRGVSYETLRATLHALDYKTLNAAMSYRPEIWGAALHMYSSFPFFGLGQGGFYRLSSISQFSGSETLVSYGGNGAHNYFLQSFVELGPVGLGIAALSAIPFFRLGRGNVHLLSFYALVGIAVGNLFAHSLLVREMLMLAAIFAGTYIWEAQTIAATRWRPPGVVAVRFTAIAIIFLALAALAESWLSLYRPPFTYGQRCSEPRALDTDQWTRGTLRVPVPPDATHVALTVRPDRLDLSWRPFGLELAIMNSEGRTVLHESLQFDRGSTGSRSIALELGASVGDSRSLELRPTNCFVPLNLGITPDRRHLGVRVTNLEFQLETPSGSQ